MARDRACVNSSSHCASMGASCSCHSRTLPASCVQIAVSEIVGRCINDDPDVIASIIAMLPLERWDACLAVNRTWAEAVRWKMKETTHAKQAGFHPGLSSDGFSWPTCVAARPGGAGLMVSEAWSHRIRFFDTVGRESGSLGCAGRRAGEMIYPTGVAIEPDTGSMYVVDSGNHRIQKFGKDAEYLAEVGSAGGGAGQFGNPKAIVAACNLLYVSDCANHRLSVFDRELNWIRHVGTGTAGDGERDFNSPDGLAVWHGGTGTADARDQTPLLFVADSANNRYVRTRLLEPSSAPIT